jgi:hypothetical protein
MLFAKSQEQQVRQHIRQEIERRLSRAPASEEIRSFLLQHWSLLLFGIYANHGDQHQDWEAGWHSVNALLWSLTPKQPGHETQQLLRLLPTLLGRLQEGCEALGLAQPERDQLFAHLALLHAGVVRGSLQEDVAEQGPMTLLGEDADLDMDDTELVDLVASGEEGELAVEVPFAPPVSAGTPTTDHAGAIGNLKVGDAVYFRLAEADKTLFVQWISPMGGMYLFADEAGSNALSLTLARLAEKFASGEAWRE